ncbi:hypothetical protein [Streptomyces sp. NPDC052496]|uniref:hypothetical protein n=1 Tax=Streptomyces sp. NPDC052496 TaxID=3154951 RepID=UPI0034164069
MSDEYDDEVYELGSHLMKAYQRLVKVCALLPVPITLPAGPVYDSRQIIPAVNRIVTIIDDQPVPTEVRSGIWGSSLHWLSAANLYTQYIATEGDEVLAMQIKLNAATAGEILHYMEELLTDDE